MKGRWPSHHDFGGSRCWREEHGRLRMVTSPRVAAAASVAPQIRAAEAFMNPQDEIA